MDIMLLSIYLIGIISAALASIFPGDSGGFFIDVLLGILGELIVFFIIAEFGSTNGFNLYYFLQSFIGALMIIAIIRVRYRIQNREINRVRVKKIFIIAIYIVLIIILLELYLGRNQPIVYIPAF